MDMVERKVLLVGFICVKLLIREIAHSMSNPGPGNETHHIMKSPSTRGKLGSCKLFPTGKTVVNKVSSPAGDKLFRTLAHLSNQRLVFSTRAACKRGIDHLFQPAN